MSHGRDHPHAKVPSYGPSSPRRLALALSITALYFAAEVAGGILSNSLALLSDAAHMFTDVLALSMALVASRLAARPARAGRSFGLYRVEVLAALANGVLLLVAVGAIVREALLRLSEPPEVKAPLLLAVAGVGLVVNVAGAWILSSGRKDNLNMRAAFLHVVGDLLGSLAVIVGGAVALWTGSARADALAGFVVAALVAVSAARLLKDAVWVLIEGSPLDTDEVAKVLRAEGGVLGVHDVHAWSLTPGVAALTAHLVVSREAASDPDRVLLCCEKILQDRFGVRHATLQIESSERCLAERGAAGCALGGMGEGTGR